MSLDLTVTDAKTRNNFPLLFPRCDNVHSGIYSPPSRKLKSGQPLRAIVSLMKIVIDDDVKLQPCDLDSFMSTVPTKQREDTGCSTQGASTCDSQMEISEAKHTKPPKSSFFAKTQRQAQELPASAELKFCFSQNEIEQDPCCTLSFLDLKQREDSEDKFVTKASDSECSSNSECSGVEMLLEDSSLSSSDRTIGPNHLRGVALEKNKIHQKGNLDIDEPKFSDSSSCNFSFEYLREDCLEEFPCENSPNYIDNLKSNNLQGCRSTNSFQTTLGSCKRRSQSPKIQKKVPEIINKRSGTNKICLKTTDKTIPLRSLVYSTENLPERFQLSPKGASMKNILPKSCVVLKC